MKLNIFFTAGYFTSLSTLEIIKELETNGIDFIEVGMPYSDPVVDGPVIQKANYKALKNGMSISKLFEELKGLKETIKVPVILMGYLNPVMQYGMERFCEQAHDLGVQGLILPDLPPHVYEKDYKTLFEKYDLKVTFIITPQTTIERITYLDGLSEGFIYAVADSSITGSELDHKSREAYFLRLKEFNFKNECFVGFGIRTKEDLNYLSQFVSGGIIGSAFIQYLDQEQGELKKGIKNFISRIKLDSNFRNSL